MVAALRTATDREPQVAGKPQPTLMTDALSRGDFRTPLVVGDRLDTDIAGANAADLPSLMVLQRGQHRRGGGAAPIPQQRPNYIAADLRRSTTADAGALRVGPHPGLARRDRRKAAVTVHTTGDEPRDALTVVRATASAVWNSDVDGADRSTIVAGDDIARQAAGALVAADVAGGEVD